MTDASISERIARLRDRVAAAAERAGRSASDITIVAVTKTVELQRIEETYREGICDFGENYVQEALSKLTSLSLELKNAHWHFIGHLQTNKVRDIVRLCSVIESVDSVRVAQEIARRSLAAANVTDILLEVKLDPADAKFGFEPDQVADAVDKIQDLAGVRVAGLMGMAPFSDRAEQSRSSFAALYNLYKELPAASQQMLSMGMSGDFEIGIEEGATHIRIGTAIFGLRR